jgi:hypothetical protein
MARRDIRELLQAAAQELQAPDPDEVTQNHRIEELTREVRQKQPSVPEIHVHTTAPNSERIEIAGPVGIKVKASGTTVAIVVALLAGVAGVIWVLMH